MPEDGPPPEDHLAELCFAAEGASAGAYTPDRTTLTLAGADAATDHVVYLHEIHHAGLNDSTAWGTALHLFAALPEPYRACFLPLLDACRLPHEAFATYASVSVASARHAEAAVAVLDHYPAYVPLYEALARTVAPVAGPHRRYLAATALARLAMQTPLLDVLLERPSLVIAPADLRAIDTPNGRWRWFLRSGPELAAAAARAADAAVRETHGRDPLRSDRPGADPDEVAAEGLDAAWEIWEKTAYALVAEQLEAAGASTLEFNGHMDAAAAVLERGRGVDPTLKLKAARLAQPAPDDRALAGATIARVRLTLADGLWPARLLDLEADQLVDEVDDRNRIAGKPGLVLTARLPARLASSFRWDGDDHERLAIATSPLVAARAIEQDEDGTVIAHLMVRDPAFLAEALTVWQARGPVVSVVSASCLVDTIWRDRWLPALRDAGPLVVLVDVELERFVGSWVTRDATVYGGAIHVEDAARDYWAIGISADDDPTLWLALADEMTTRLFLEQLRQTPGLAFESQTSHLERWSGVLPVVLTHLLATESFLDFEGLDEQTLARARDG
jgi:hypothetical protein